MTDYGVTSTGFVRKPQSVILSEIETSEIADIDPALDVSSDQPIGQLNGIMSSQFSELWELAESIYGATDRDKAEGDALVALAKLTGTAKNPAQYATCKVTIGWSGGADTIVSGTHFISLDTDPTIRFTPIEDIAIAGAGTYTGQNFRAENTGPVTAATGHLTVIATPISGWDSATNTTDATGGKNADGDPELRTSMAAEAAATGSATVDALIADVLALNEEHAGEAGFSEITVCAAFENVGDTVDANGLPPHSFEILVYDGASPGADNDNLIAQKIWDGKDQGIRTWGTSSGTAVDAQGNSQTVLFTRLTARNVYLTYDLDVDTTPPYVGDAQFKTDVAAAANTLYDKQGGTVVAARVSALAFDEAGVIDVVSLKLGFTATPTGTANLSIGSREIARFDSSRIVVT